MAERPRLFPWTLSSMMCEAGRALHALALLGLQQLWVMADAGATSPPFSLGDAAFGAPPMHVVEF
jgi:hypothetical protein